jgi:hypothetical protein
MRSISLIGRAAINYTIGAALPAISMTTKGSEKNE